MDKRKVVLTVVLAFLALATILIFTQQPERRVYAEKDAEEIILIKADDKFMIELIENPSTGYSWHWAIDGDAVITLESEQFIPAEAKETVGSPGKHEFEFKALEPGSTLVKFEYYRPWESGNVAETLVFNIEVK